MDYKIPEQYTGAQSETIVRKDFSTSEEASKHYEQVREKFYNINECYYENGKKKSKFHLCDANENALDCQPEVNHYIRINVQGPENSDGDGDDWVKITFTDEEEHENEKCCIIEVKPCDCPSNCKTDTAHFYDAAASNSFILRQYNNSVILEIHGRNEKVNKEKTSFFNKLRNTIMGLGGILGGSKSQWDDLAENLMN